MRPARRRLALALPVVLVLTGLLAYQYGYLPARAELSARKELQDQKLRTLRKEIGLISRQGELGREQQGLIEARKTAGADLVDGASMAVAGETLRQMVKTVITARGGTVLSENVDKPETKAGLTVLGTTTEAAFPDTKALSDTLHALETQRPRLALVEVDVRIKDQSDPRDLGVRIRVSAVTGAR